MERRILTKWNIADIVAPKLSQAVAKNTFFEIREIKTVTCSAGTQIFYRGRLWDDCYDAPGKRRERSMDKGYTEFHEDELTERAPNRKA